MPTNKPAIINHPATTNKNRQPPRKSTATLAATKATAGVRHCRSGDSRSPESLSTVPARSKYGTGATVTVKSARESNPQFLMVEKQGAIATLFFTNQEARVFNEPRRGATKIKDSGLPLFGGSCGATRRGISTAALAATPGFDPESRVFN